jgi:hypothetical protein
MTKRASPPPEVSRVSAGRDDRVEAAGGPAELTEDAGLDLLGEGSVGPGGQVRQRGDERRILAGQPQGLLTGRVNQPDAVVSKVRDLEAYSPWVN